MFSCSVDLKLCFNGLPASEALAAFKLLLYPRVKNATLLLQNCVQLFSKRMEVAGFSWDEPKAVLSAADQGENENTTAFMVCLGARPMHKPQLLIGFCIGS